MEPSSRPRVKVCCIASAEEARLAVRHGASALGLVSEMPSGPGVIPEALIAEIAAGIPPPVMPFLLTCLQDPEALAAQQRRAGIQTLQLCDRLALDAYPVLRRLVPGVRLVQVIHVTGEEALDDAREVAGLVDALLLDSGDPRLAVKQLGGTGRRHDWEVSRRIREESPVPLFLAGGLVAGNVREAVDTVAPFGLDVCTGVRTGSRLDEAKLAAFFVASL